MGLDLNIRYKGISRGLLNDKLAKSQQLTQADADRIKKVHCKIYRLHERIVRTNDAYSLKALALLMQRLEFKLQQYWKFKPDARKHYLWLYLPKCSCPKSDNRERIGTGSFIIDQECPLHGGPDYNELVRSKKKLRIKKSIAKI